MIDMHIHSNNSDGELSPEKTVEIAFQNGAKVISLTDHDNVGGNDEAKKVCDKLGIKFITGIEISAKENKSLHILGYGIDICNSYLLEMCEKFEESRSNRTGAFLELLQKHNMNICEDDVLKFSEIGVVTRPHFARAMVEKGYVSTVKQAFDEYLETPEFRQIKRYKPSYKEAINLIHQAGGLAVMAHPYQLKLSDSELDSLVAEMKENGLDGMECYYSWHTPEMMLKYRDMIEKYNMYTSIGSDFHGYAVKPDITAVKGNNNSLIKLQEVSAYWGNRDITSVLIS